jgi:3-dehydroquinate synthase
MGLWNEKDAQRQRALIEKTGLPTQIPSHLDPNMIIDILQTDKKVKAGKVRFILPTAIGKVIITDEVTTEILQDILQES